MPGCGMMRWAIRVSTIFNAARAIRSSAANPRSPGRSIDSCLRIRRAALVRLHRELLTGYDVGPGKPVAHSRVRCYEGSRNDVGGTRQVFGDPTFHFQGDVQTANIAPDVTVVFADSRYHLAYDWLSDNSDWSDAFDPPAGFDGGCALRGRSVRKGLFIARPTQSSARATWSGGLIRPKNTAASMAPRSSAGRRTGLSLG